MMKTLVVFLFLIPSWSFATDFKLVRSGSHVDVQVLDVPMPMDELGKDLNSGLSTIIVGTINVWKGEALLSKTSLTWKIYFDLWDEVFHLQRLEGDKKISQSTFKKSEFAASLSHYTFPSVFSLEQIKQNSNLSLTFNFVIDPISKEKRKRIKKWLAQNQVSIPSSQPITSSIKTPSAEPATRGSVNRGLFGQMLDSELDEDINSAKWTYSSPKMDLSKKALSNEK